MGRQDPSKQEGEDKEGAGKEEDYVNTGYKMKCGAQKGLQNGDYDFLALHVTHGISYFFFFSVLGLYTGSCTC